MKTYPMSGLQFRSALFYIALFVAAFWIYGKLWLNAPVSTDDASTYQRLAQDLQDFKLDRLHGRTPGYPVLLLLTGSQNEPNRALFYVALSLHFASIGMLASALHLIGVSKRTLAVFCLLMLLPPYVESAGYVLTENLTEFMLVAASVCLVWWVNSRKTGWLVISAFAAAYAGFVRPSHQLLALALTSYIILAACVLQANFRVWEVIKAGLILVSISIVFVGGLAWFNFRNTGYFDTTSMTGLALTSKTARVLERLPDEYGQVRELLIAARDAELVERDGPHFGNAYISSSGLLSEIKGVTGLNDPELSKYMVKLNIILIRSAPLVYLEEVLHSVGTYWMPASTSLSIMDRRTLQLIWALVHFSVVGTFSIIIIVGIGEGIDKMISKSPLRCVVKLPADEAARLNVLRFAFGTATTVVFYTMLVSTLCQSGEPRYCVPTYGLIIYICFLGFHVMRNRGHKLRSCGATEESGGDTGFTER